MEHNDNEQSRNLNADQQPGQPGRSGDSGLSDDLASFVPAVLARLGLSPTASSPAVSEEQRLKVPHHPAWLGRLEAVQNMEMRAGPAHQATLLHALHDKHENVRVAAARALSSLAS